MHIKRLSSFFVILLATCLFSEAQTLTKVWEKHFQGTGDNSDRFNKIVSDGNGAFVAVGYSIKPGNYRDFLTVKLDSNGDTLWWRTKNGKASGDDEATLVSVDLAGNIYVAGNADGGKSQDDIYLLKYNSAGVLLWDTSWNSPSYMDDVPTDMALDGSGNIFICGNAEPDTVSGSMDYITLKFASNGALLWNIQYSRNGVTSGKDEAAALAIDNSGNCYVTGRSFNGSDDDMITFKYDGSNGTVLFTQVYNGGGGDDRGVDVVLDNNGDIIVTGRSDNGSNQDFRTIKYSSAGGILWSKFYNGPANQNDRPVKIAVNSANDVYIAGEGDVDNSAAVDYDYVLVKYNSAGTPQWGQRVGSNAENDTPSDLAIDQNGNIIITGKADLNTNVLITNNDFMTVQYTSGGSLNWVKFHAGTLAGGTGSDIASSVYLDSSGNIYVAGGAENTGTQKDAVVVKYDPAGNVTWFNNYNGEGDFSESGRSIVIDANENSYVGGYSFREGHNRDIIIVKMNTDGDTLCSFLYNGSQSDDDEIEAMAIDASGNVYATGYAKNVGQKSDMITIKFDPSTCDTIWTRTYNYAANQSDKGISIVVDAAGNCYVTGRSDSNPLDTIDNDDIVTVKYDLNGNQVWLQRYNGPGNLRDEPSRILLDNSGHVLVCGRAEKINDDDFFLIKYSAATGDSIWPTSSLYNGPFANDDRALDMTIDAMDNIFVCGYSQTGSGNAPDDAAVVKFDSSGAPVSFFFFDGTGLGTDQALAITRDNLNQVYVAFRTDADPNPLVANYNYLTMKFDNDLNSLWANPPQYNGPINSDDIPVAITTNAGGDIIVTGYSKNDTLSGRTNVDWVTIRYNSLGVQSQILIYDGAFGGDDEPNAVALRGSLLWVTGFSIGNGNNQKDITTLKFDLTVGIPSVLNQNIVSSLYPNPFSEKAILEINKNNQDPMKVQLFDILGNLVRDLDFEGSSAVLEKGNMTAGMYFYRVIQSSDIVATGKFIVE